MLSDVTAATYHDDLVADVPTLSKSIIQLLLTASPAHARQAHPRLNPNWERKEEQKFDLGNAVHQVFLEGVDAVAVCPFDSWRTAAAKEERDAARAAGRIPMLPADYERVEEMVVALRAQLEVREDSLFTDGKAETTIIWEERGVLCRARLDWLRDDLTACDDLKTASRSANPETWCRHTLYSIGADVQQAFYLRGIEAVTGQRPEFRFCVVETESPFAMSVVTCGPAALELANKKVDFALDLWRKCLENDEWPAYDQRVHFAELPPWIESQWIDRELREVA